MTDAPDLPRGTEVLALVRRYEPVLRFTAGEMFFPMPVDDYLAQASLWSSTPDGGAATLLVDQGELTPDTHAATARAHPDAYLFLRYAPRSLSRRDLRTWRRRPDRPRFTGVSRLAAVGLLGRIIDLGMRLSLTLRGRVPGGLVAAAQQQYATRPGRDAYHAHVSADGGYVVIQYWFLYAMNDWRTSFSGVNDHESDWEQVTVYLVGATLDLAWVAFSSHDETGDDLRRRPDDPDITWVDGTHPVVHTGAGSHSGAYLAGDYLVRVQPEALARPVAVLTGIRSVLFPWTRHRRSVGVGIPYVDYRRGDGVHIGPGTDRPWTILVDSQTPWVRDYRGLWGLDTADPFGGERAPAGPRYERSGAIRTSWADPVGWAGLDKVPPTAAAHAEAQGERIGELDALIADLTARIAGGQEELRRAGTGVEALPATVTSARYGGPGAPAGTTARENAIAALRARRRDAQNERDQLRHVPVGARRPPPHAHLRHRAVPETATSTGVLLRFWSGASLSILLVLIGLALLLRLGPVLVVSTGAVLIVMAIEALLRGRLLVFLLSVAIVAGNVALVWLLFTHLRVALGVLAIAAAVAIGIANVRMLLVRR